MTWLCLHSLPPGLWYMKKMEKWTSAQWYERIGKPFEAAELIRKASLPADCHLAPDEDPNWTAWRQVEGVFGLHWERETIEPSIPLIDLILPDA